ncbi:phosphotransferase [Actinopolymorpha sp. B9G3]|uniref:phosphotransferase n=1 Tax=Actinopolymorpha sp. B9G3 TaxID=3158970 RepID=UPI0032D8CBBC
MTEHRLEFRISENPWAPAAAVVEINERCGCGLELVGLAEQEGGVSSAAFVRWPDGRDGAISRSKLPLARMRQTAEAVNLAKAAGLPVARHELVVQLSDGLVAIVQERLPGRHATRIDARVIDAVVETNERFAHLLADRLDIPTSAAFPTPDGGGHRWEETLGQYSDRTRRVLKRLYEIDGGELYAMTGDDLIHTDYSLGNLLFDEQGEISGIVDWNFGAERGDRRYALLGMRGYLAGDGRWHEGHDAASDRLEEVLATMIEPALLRTYLAHRAVHGLHGSIENFPHRPDRIERDLRAAEMQLAT